MSGWDDPETAAWYEAFCRRHSRYLRANRELIAHAQIAPGMRVLDVAAGTGRTAEAILRSLGESGRVLCFEPSAAMRSVGMRRITDSRVRWGADLPDATESFDRILCGASIWLLDPLPQTFLMLASLLCPGGALCFNIPALYLLEPDEPGGGSDPSLLLLPELLLASLDAPQFGQAAEPRAPNSHVLGRHVPGSLSQSSITAWLNAAGLRADHWLFRMRLSQIAYANWLKIPVLTEQLLGKLSPKARAERIDAALESVESMDRSSWKWEQWRGWTAWKDHTP
jgi:ubiquinone/menaquinone biosynthesis C-methylase UbiE